MKLVQIFKRHLLWNKQYIYFFIKVKIRLATQAFHKLEKVNIKIYII